jgi:predicted dehydrogenase
LTGGQTADVPWSWRFDRATAGFGVLRAFHHVLDELHWHFGPVERVAADFQTFTAARPDPATRTMRPADVEDAVAFVARTAGGAHVLGDLDRAVRGRNTRSTEIVGDRATARLTFPDHRDRATTLLEIAGEAAEPAPLHVPCAQDAFVDAIATGLDAPTTFRHGLAALLLAETLREADAAGEWTELPAEYLELFTPPSSPSGTGTLPGP